MGPAVIPVAFILTAASTAYGVVQTVQANNDKKKALEEQKRQELERGRRDAELIRRNADQVKSAQLAAIAAGGAQLGEGTANTILSETSRLSELDALTALRDANNKARLIEMERSSIPSTGASLFGGALDIGAAGVNAYNSYSSAKTADTLLTSRTTSKAAMVTGGSR
jgi:hypothetical protein